MPIKLKSKLSFEEIKILYLNDEMTLTEIAKIAGIHYLTVRKKLIKNGITTRKTITEKTREKFVKASTGRKRSKPLTSEQKENIRKGILNSSWSKNASGVTIRNGYVSMTKGENRYQNEHRLIMEGHIGRKLIKGEIVHHIDGNRKNNSLENLQLMSHYEHSRFHALENNHKRKRCKKGRYL